MNGQTAVIPAIIERHFADAAFLSQLRRRACAAPDWSLTDLANLDERLEGHLDGLRVSGEYGWKVAEAALQEGAHEQFVAGVLAVESRERSRIARVLRDVKSPETFEAVVWSFERVAPMFLQGTIKDLLESPAPLGRRIGVAACACHGVNPGQVLARLVGDPDLVVRARAIQACGELGLTAHLEFLATERNSADANLLWWTAWTSVLLGNRGGSLDAVTCAGVEPSPHRARAFPLMLQAMKVGPAHATLQRVASDTGSVSRLIRGSGIVGDPAYIPWLIGHMANASTARSAGESFSLITGVDLGQAGLAAKRPENFESGPNDDPDDPNVDMDPDDGLPWPDVPKIQHWWAANGGRFQKGTRYFVGAPVTHEHCVAVLKSGYQRQRILAAHYLCLLEPGTPLFNTSAPAWRQQRLLAKMA